MNTSNAEFAMRDSWCQNVGLTLGGAASPVSLKLEGRERPEWSVREWDSDQDHGRVVLGLGGRDGSAGDLELVTDYRLADDFALVEWTPWLVNKGELVHHWCMTGCRSTASSPARGTGRGGCTTPTGRRPPCTTLPPIGWPFGQGQGGSSGPPEAGRRAQCSRFSTWRPVTGALSSPSGGRDSGGASSRTEPTARPFSAPASTRRGSAWRRARKCAV